ncbi:MAG: pyridoxal-dependent decarboxylase [Xanthomonadales bacterium]|jgi:aromatic-L-amino-acid decarboxylase|nr:pyridoxal-dependent decarboxylase [Xanthomonadales bacterium]
MTPEEFRLAGHELIDWIADNRQGIESLPVRAQVAPGEVRNALPASPPEKTVSFQQLMSELERVVVPGITQVQHPMHFGWFPSNASLSSVLGDITCAGLGTLGISWESCPALTEVEEVVCDWMRQLAGLPEEWKGTIHDTASTACVTALMAARERQSDYSEFGGGLQSLDKPLVVYSTDQAHSSVVKAALLAGFGQDNLHWIATDPKTHAMSVPDLEKAMAKDVAAGRVPAAVVVSLGSTGVTAFDPVGEIVRAASGHGAWVHADAAMAGSAMLLPECRHLFEGIEKADSISWNPHKWMGTILDTSLFYVRDPLTLNRVMSTNPSYLRSAEDGQVTQYRDWGIPLGRRFRALKLWFHLSLDGPEAICERLRRDLANARWLEKQVRQSENWKVVSPLTLQTVCIRHEPPGLEGDELDCHTLDWVNEINRSGAAFLTASLLDGRWMVRVSVGVESTEREHVQSLWELLQSSATRCLP